jgi:hypothetical protein
MHQGSIQLLDFYINLLLSLSFALCLGTKYSLLNLYPIDLLSFLIFLFISPLNSFDSMCQEQ